MRKNAFFALCFLIFLHTNNVFSSQESEIVEGWAEKFGKELWDLATTITKTTEIKDSYKIFNAQVEKKDPQSLLSVIVENVTRMLKRKIDAVRCILRTAEDAAEEYVANDTETDFSYYSTKYSFAENIETGKNYTPKLPESIPPNNSMYLHMSLAADTHFLNSEVDTAHSAVHVPTNVYDRSKLAKPAIEWSKQLDDVFIQNYKADRELSWQYFCSSSGIMRHYPAMHWDSDPDLFDCRTRSWFIEAASCSKDVVILVDESGSMSGMGKHLAKFTVFKILDTFSNNDYVNILKYNDTVKPVEPCFNGTLVQATIENIKILKNRMEEIHPNGNANLAVAMTAAFKLLNESRQRNGCGDESTGCNQAVMLVTDGVPNNITEVFEEYNWLNNGTTIPVRVFTYLIGLEVSNIEEITWMACLNRGYFVHVRSLDEATEQVLKYIQVIARPLVLQGVDHPVSWTHAYITDNTFEDKENDFEDYKLMTSVAVPAYDRKINSDNKTRRADLLGIAGTDVLIEDIEKQTIPYKIGVNGYAFIVTNNGYLLMHPNLRPLYEGILNENYNSMDLTEVEFMDDDMEPRELNEKMLELREALVNHSTGSMLGLPIKHFYDEMRRAYIELYDYYYAPLNSTPFSIAIAVPQSHGDNWLKVGDEISRNNHMNIDIVKEYFSGSNWKIHPKWLYCKYYYIQSNKFKKPEDEFLHFLKNMNQGRFKWPHKQYQDEDNDMWEFNAEEQLDCDRNTPQENDYYCDKELVQRLVFDAKVTAKAFKPWKFKSDRDRQLFEMYSASLRYVATMSGLTRWEYIFGEDNDTELEFGDLHSRAIDETWYKSAVLQHKADPDSFVYSVPFKKDDGDLMITGSHAIFPRDAGVEAPGCVVGFQFQHANMYERFREITSKPNCECCINETKNGLIDCYVIDSNGYIILSKNENDTGKFFGEVAGAVMESMVLNEIFDKVTVYDFQSVCTRVEIIPNDSSTLLTPVHYIGWLLQWIIHRTIWLLFENNLYYMWTNNWVNAVPFDVYDTDNSDFSIEIENVRTTPKPPRKYRKGEEEQEYWKRQREKPPKNITISEPCDKQATLYILNQTKFINREVYSGEEKSECSRPFFVKRISHSNLILVVVDAGSSTCNKKLNTAPKNINYNSDNQPPCHKLELNALPRRKLSGCYNEHPLEHEIKICGKSAHVNSNFALIISGIILLELINKFVVVFCSQLTMETN